MTLTVLHLGCAFFVTVVLGVSGPQAVALFVMIIPLITTAAMRAAVIVEPLSVDGLCEHFVRRCGYVAFRVFIVERKISEFVYVDSRIFESTHSVR